MKGKAIEQKKMNINRDTEQRGMEQAGNRVDEWN